MIERGFEKAQELRENKTNVRKIAILLARKLLKATGVVDPRLEVRKQPTTARVAETPRPRGLEYVRSAIEIPTVSEGLYNRTREAVEQAGYNFIVQIRPVSVEDLLTEDRQREQRGGQRRFGYVNDSKTMRSTVPPEMEVAINPTRFKILRSNRLSTDGQKNEIKQEQVNLRGRVRSDIQHLVNMEMVDISTLSQLEDAYMDKTGNLLFPDYFVRTDIKTVGGHVARIGRLGPARRRRVDDSHRGRGGGSTFGVYVVVLPRKLTA